MAEPTVESSTETVLNVAKTGTIKVLHVDDDQTFLKVAKQCLDTQGEFEVDTASSVNEALEKLKKTDYDAIVSDYQMPGKDGLEFLKELREKGNTVPFIVFTGKGREEIAMKALNLSADGYFNKSGCPKTVYGELAHGMRQVVGKRRAEQSFLKSEDKYRRLVETLREGIWIIDKDSRTTFVNPRMAEILGYDIEEMKGRHLFSFMDERGVEIAKRLLERRKQGIKEQHDFEFLRKDGTRVYVTLETAPITDDNGNYIGALASVMDITERKKAEKETESMAKFSAENPESVLRISSDGTLLYANQASQNMLKESQSKEDRTLIETLRRRVADAFSSNERSLFEEEHGGRIFQFNVVPVASEGYANLYATDITERKQLEKQLKESEEKYRNLVENCQDAIAIVDFKGNVLFANKAAERLTGYTLKEGKGLNIRVVTPKRHWPKGVAMLLKARMGKPILYFEYELKRKDGTIVPVETGGQAIFEDGKPVAIQIITREIIERRKAEQMLKESEEKYRRLVELAPEGVLAVNTEGIVTSANRSFLRLVGYDSAEEIVGKPFMELMAMRMEDIPKFQEMFKSVMKGESTSPSEFLYVRRDGTSRWAEVNPGLLTKEGNPVGVQVLMRDVTERKNTEKLILENQQRYAALFIGNPEATVYTDPSFHIVDVNPRFASLFRYLPSEVKGKHLTDVVVPERLIAESNMLEKKAAEGYATYDTVRKRKDGSLIPVSVSCAPIFVQDKPAGYISVYKDISEQTNAQRKLTMMNEKLQVVGGLTRHDVRSKLSAIVGNAYLAKKETAGNNRVQEYLREIEKAVQQSASIFDFARTYEMLGIEELTYIDVEKTIKEAASLFSDLKGAKVVNDCYGLNLLADSLLQQLFYNLIDNSLKYGKKTTRIRVHYEKSGKNDLVLVYEDDGVGIPSLKNRSFSLKATARAEALAMDYT